MAQQARTQPRPKHGRSLDECAMTEKARQIKIKVTKANRKKPPVTLPTIKALKQD